MKSRKPNRLKNYDYSRNGFYFATNCTFNKECNLGEIKKGRMYLNRYGEIVEKQWLWLAEQYSYIKHDEYLIMPNHVHGIVIINRDDVGERSRPFPTENQTIIRINRGI